MMALVEPGSSEGAPARARVSIIRSPKSWIEGEAVQQLEKTAELPGMRRVVGMPDLHPGKGTPIGAVFLSDDRLYPHLVGNDIGCGMALWTTSLRQRKKKLDRWIKRLDGAAMEGAWEGDARARLEQAGVASGEFETSLGTVGGGNHFAELQEVAEVHDDAGFKALGLERGQLHLLVHSGSRGLGQSILRAHVDEHKAAGLASGSEEAEAYRTRHDHAEAWARVNRAVIATRFLDAIGGELRGGPAIDVCHNSVHEAVVDGCACWLHRKGAAPSDEGPVVIPGSRGAMSYLVRPTGDREGAGLSLAHGAGRRWRRSDARGRLRKRFKPGDLERTALGGRVICEDRDLLYEEAPQAYKDVDVVVADLAGAGLLEIIATLKPLITYKTRRRE